MKPTAEDIAGHLADGSMARDEWVTGLQGMVDLLAADHAMIVAHDSATGQPLVVTSAGVHADDFGRFTSPEAEDWMRPFRRAMPNGTAVRWSTLMSDRQFERSVLYNEVVRPANGFYAVATRLDLPAVSVFLAVCRSKRNRDFAPGDATALQGLLPLFTANVELQHRLRASEQRHSELTGVLDRVDAGIVLVDGALRPVFVNARAREIASAKDGLILDEEGLAAGGPLETKALREAVASAIRPDRRDPKTTGMKGAPIRLRITRLSARPFLTVNVMPVSAGLATGRTEAAPLAAVFVFEPESPPVIDAALLTAAFGLAPREGEIAVLLAGGARLSEAARTLGIGIGTARWYLKRVLEKTNTHRQAELTQLIRHGFGNRGA